MTTTRPDRPRRAPSRRTLACCLVLLTSAGGAAGRATTIARWSFDGSPAGANEVPGGPEARLDGARLAEGRSGRAAVFQDWSVVDYLRPDPRKATRVTVPHDSRLNPPVPFRVTAWIYPTADPIYYGGIVEKGRGFGSSYRLLLLRGLKVAASLGEAHLTVRSQAPITLGAWHEVSLSATGDAIVLIVDGVEVARRAVSEGTRIAGREPLVIGERFTGRIDDVRIETP